jgi:hypothetical protein
MPTALLPVLFSAFLVLALLLVPLTQNVGEQEAAEPTPAHDVATNQQANEAVFLACCTSFALDLFLSLPLFLSLFLSAPLSEQVGEKHRAQAPASDHAAAN